MVSQSPMGLVWWSLHFTGAQARVCHCRSWPRSQGNVLEPSSWAWSLDHCSATSCLLVVDDEASTDIRKKCYEAFIAIQHRHDVFIAFYQSLGPPWIVGRAYKLVWRRQNKQDARTWGPWVTVRGRAATSTWTAQLRLPWARNNLQSSVNHHVIGGLFVEAI